MRPSVNCSCRFPASQAIISPREEEPFGHQDFLVPSEVALQGAEAMNVLNTLEELIVGFHGRVQ